MATTPIEKDAYIGPYVQLLFARVHVMVGDQEKAVELLKPGYGSIRLSIRCGSCRHSGGWWR